MRARLRRVRWAVERWVQDPDVAAPACLVLILVGAALVGTGASARDGGLILRGATLGTGGILLLAAVVL